MSVRRAVALFLVHSVFILFTNREKRAHCVVTRHAENPLRKLSNNIIYCFFFFTFFVGSFVWRFSIWGGAIDRWESAWIHRRSLSESSDTRRFGTVCAIYTNSYRISSLIYFKFFCRNHGWSEEEVLQIMLSLKARGVIKSMEYNSFTRTHHEDTEIKASACEWHFVIAFVSSNHLIFRTMTLGGEANANNCIE